MFYRKEEIDSALICSFCSETMRDPRILPCGTSACHECIRSRSNADYELECLYCTEKHTAPNQERGFYPNMCLQKILESKVESAIAENLETKIQTKSEALPVKLEIGADKIKSEFRLRNQVHLEGDFAFKKEMLEILSSSDVIYFNVFVHTWRRHLFNICLISRKRHRLPIHSPSNSKKFTIV
jgi:hypothetical protein